MAEDSSNTSRKDYWRTYNATKYAEKGDTLNLQRAIRYYRKKKAEGLEWTPGPRTKLRIWCQERGIDVIAIIEGTQLLPE